MFNPQAYENSRPDGIGVLEIIDPDAGEKAPRRFVPLRRTELHGEVTGPHAQAASLGTRLADDLLARGAGEILAHTQLGMPSPS